MLRVVSFWCWSWNSSTLATWCEELTHWKRPWCWERLRAGGEGDGRGWDGWMASLTRWTWVWVDSGGWWWTGRPGVLWSMGSQRIGHDWATELNWTDSQQGFPRCQCRRHRDVGSIPGSGRSPREENGNSLQYSCLEKPWTEEPGRLQSIRSQRAGHDRSDLAHTHTLNQHSSAFQGLILAPSVFTVHSLNYWNMILVFEPPWYFHCLGIFFPGLSQVIYRTRGRWIPLSCEGRKSND